ncbi:MAG TPA: hypothetical protein DCS66_08270 [Flavobacteriaceae bacterium]|nr:hypothetical protein [Flavobacteriaceae bacterium]HAT64584.1 hypothetical protein [Flavobacteriaceae bacterium]|tara:strand:+ start:131 stop:973 length:843 start_codon:yes stop_codon:yes gene_type:complete
MTKQNPFSVYDFLGYLIPGSVLIYSYLIIDYLKTNKEFNSTDFVSSFSKVEFESIFFFIILSYIIGHLLSFISSITVEKYANWVYSYPSKYLLDMKYDKFWDSARKWTDILWRIIIIILLFPCVIFDLFFGNFLNFKKFYTSPLDSLLRNIILNKLNILLGKLGHKFTNEYKNERGYANEYDFNRIATHYAYENSKNHQAKMSNYVALYGFLRTLCLIFNFLSIYLFLRVSIYLNWNLENFSLFIFLSGITYLTFMAFMKFYRRYTLEGLMIIAIDENLK